MNDYCFAQPHWWIIASGHDVERWFGDGQAVGSGGMMAPAVRHLRVGQKYFRFASSTSTTDSQLGGGWWVDYESFSTIKQFALTHHYSLSDAARLFLALPYEWTRVDRLISAILEVPLKAYAGLGKTAEGTGKDDRDAGTKWIPPQHNAVIQLYIPGLYVRGKSPQLYSQAFPSYQIEYAATA